MIPSRNARRQQVAVSESLPPPIGGLNARDALANMPATDAVVLENLFPGTTDVQLRAGYESFATFTGQCESVIPYRGATTKIFVGVVNGSTRSIFDATSGGALSSVAVGGSGPTVQALTSTRFDYQNFTSAGAARIVVVLNGADTPVQYNGTSWSADVSTGVTLANLFTAASFAERLFYGQKDTLDVWYHATGAITGALTKLPLGSVFRLGGVLNSIITFSLDSSSELSDHIAFISDQGEVVVYSGTDPSDATKWSRVAQFTIGRPVCKGQRCATTLGGQAVIICTDGLYPLTKAVLARDNIAQAVSDKIRDLINRDIVAYGANFGWNVVVHPTGSKCIVNVPTTENSRAWQYVMNTQTGAWCKFTGWNAFCIEVDKDTLYFGSDGFLAKADTGTDDGGSTINTDAAQAYSYFGIRGQNKQFTMARPTLAVRRRDSAVGTPIRLRMGVSLDFRTREPTSVVVIEGAGDDPFAGFWSVAWSGGSFLYRGWQSVTGLGCAAAPRLKLQAADVLLSWSSTDLLYQPCEGVL